MGFEDREYSLPEAQFMISRAQDIRYYAFQLAHETWGIDIESAKLNAIIKPLFDSEDDRELIAEIMQRNIDIAYDLLVKDDEAHAGDARYVQKRPRDFTPKLTVNRAYKLVRKYLEFIRQR